MKESKETYYDILGVTNWCTAEDIKRAYIDLCKNYHPDKLHPDTPEGAKKFIAERMTLINEAYEVLKDEYLRRRYDDSLISSKHNINDTTQPSNEEDYYYTDAKNNIDSLFSQHILEDAVRQLELEEKKFEIKFRKEISDIEIRYRKYLNNIKDHTPGRTEILDSSMRLEKSIKFGLVAFLGLWLVPLGNIFLIFGLLIISVAAIYLIQILTSPAYPTNYVKAVKAAKDNRDTEVIQFKSKIEARINHFLKIPIYSVNYDFVNKLSAVDRLLLVKALKQREETENAEKVLQSTVKVAAAIGLLAIFLGSVGN
jgi:curved DNA-binding protein CbpA